MEQEFKIFSIAEHLFMQLGVKSVSMDDIAKSAGISKKTIYKFFPNKKILIRNIIRKFIENEAAAVLKIQAESKDAIHEIVQIAGHILKMLSKTKPTLKYDLQKYHKDSWKLIEDLHLQFMGQVIEKNLKNGIENKLYRSELDPELMAKIYMASTLILNEQMGISEEKYHPAELFRHYIIYHVYGIATDKGKALFETYKKDLL